MDRAKYLDEREVKQLRTFTEHRALKDLAAGRVAGPMRWMLVDLALQTGLRVGELAVLTIGDYNARRKALRVNRSKRRKPLAETMAVQPELAEHLDSFIAWKATAGQPTGPADSLFHGKRGPMGKEGLQALWRKALADADLPKLSIHKARHTNAVALLRKTRNLRLVQKRLGHSSPAVTANLYADIPFADELDQVSGLYGDGQQTV